MAGISVETGPNPGFRKAIVAGYERIDLKDPDFHGRADRDEIFRQLRADHPVYWNAEAQGSGFWVVTRFDDVEAVVRDRAVFSSDYRRGGMRIFDLHEVSAQPRPDIFTTDPPNHTVFRKALQPFFAPEKVQALEASMRRRARSLVGQLAESGDGDFVAQIAGPMAVGLLLDLLDLPAADGAQLMQWSSTFVGDDDPDLCPSIEYRIACARALDDYVANLLAERAGSGRQDVLTALSSLEIEGARLDAEALCENFASFIVATNETVRHTLSHAMLALSTFPQEREKLQADMSLMPAATREFLRWATPLLHSRRTATRDTSLAGQTIREGDKVVVWYKSANRDERRWADADLFRVDRYCDENAPGHISFGGGINHCLGWRYAQMQIAVLFEELLGLLPDIDVAGPPKFLRSNFISGLKALPVSL